jgi:hypothetical protein
MLDLATRNRVGLMGPEHVKALESKADAAATAAAIGLKADATAVTAAQAAATELQKDFVASGAITAGQFVALRSDGKVEAVTGTETLASIGADNTQLSVANEFRLLSVAHDATTNKLALLYWNNTTTRTMYAVIGTVTGDTINFGTPVVVGSGATYWTQGQIVWNAAGTTVVVFFQGASGHPYVVAGTVSGTAITLGSAAATHNVAKTIMRLIHDDTHGSRVLCFDQNGVTAVTYVGTTLSVGTRQEPSVSSGSDNQHFFDGPNARGITLAYDSGGSGTVYIKAFTVSGTTITLGTEVNVTPAILRCVALEKSTGKLLLIIGATSATSPIQGRVVTFSGANATINAAATLTDYYFAINQGQAVFDVDSGKFVLIGRTQPSSTAPSINPLVALVCTVSGTSVSAGPLTALAPFGGSTIYFVRTSTSGASKVAISYVEEGDYYRSHIMTGKVSAGAFVVTDNILVKSVPRPDTSFFGRTAIIGGWQYFDFGNWTTSTTVLTAFAMTLPTETTNADDWIGVAKATVANGATVTVALRGGLDKQRSGLTPKTPYFLKGDGTLIANDNGRPAGIAVSATELLMEAA